MNAVNPSSDVTRSTGSHDGSETSPNLAHGDGDDREHQDQHLEEHQVPDHVPVHDVPELVREDGLDLLVVHLLQQQVGEQHVAETAARTPITSALAMRLSVRQMRMSRNFSLCAAAHRFHAVAQRASAGRACVGSTRTSTSGTIRKIASAEANVIESLRRGSLRP